MASPPECAAPRRPVPVGPLPPVADLERLEALAPGATERLMRALETQSLHRQTWEMAALRFHAEERGRAQLYAFIFAMAGLATSAFLGYLGHPTTAAVVGGTTVVGVVTTFTLGSRRKAGPDELAPPSHTAPDAVASGSAA